jgi:Aminoglycoside-2''-adenylyltransferase
MLSKDFKEFIELLNEYSVRYLVVGGYAVAFHGHPRYTKDLDVWIELSPENAAKVLKALEKFGFGSLDLKPEDFLEDDQIIQLGYPPNRIDILMTLKDLKFEDCYKARVDVEIQDLHINFIDIESLKKNKRATGRPQDLADAENLE